MTRKTTGAERKDKVLKTADHNLLKDLIEKEIKAWKIKYDEEIKDLKAELIKTKSNQEINNRNYEQEIYNLKSDMKILIEKTDHILGSVSYIANEYDDFNDKITTTKLLGRSNSDEILNLRREVERIKFRQNSTDIHLDELEQYGRRENLEIHGVPVKPNESTNQVVKTLAKHLNVHLDESHISTSHRLAMKPDGKRPPPIIVRFSNRDKKNEIFGKRKMLHSNSMISSNFESDKVSIQENLTIYKKMLFNQAKLAKQYLNFSFVWTSQGRIRLRKDSGSRIINVSSLQDLAKLGYSCPAGNSNFTF